MVSSMWPYTNEEWEWLTHGTPAMPWWRRWWLAVVAARMQQAKKYLHQGW